MKRFSEQLQKKSLLIRMKAAEKDDLRDRLVSFMEYHPLAASERTPVQAKAASLPPFRIIQIPALYIRSAMGVFALLLVIGVPALAEKAVPGDILYPIKVQVTEEIRSSLNLDPYEKVAWETSRLERRITEARQLAKAGKLTPDVQASVLEAVQAQKQTTENEIATLRTTDAEGASLAQLTYTTMLDVQSSVLKADDSASTTIGKSTVALASAIDASLEEIEDKDDAGDVSIVRLQAQLELETTRAYELLQNISPVATKQEQKDIERRLSDVDHKIELASSDGASDDNTRKAGLRNAWSDIQKLISFMSDIDVRGTVAIETLVPVVPTDSEQIVLVMDHLKMANTNLQRIEQGLGTVKNAGILNKINHNLPRVYELLLTASTSIANIASKPTNLGSAIAASSEALALTDSMLALATFPAAVTTSTPTTTTPVVGNTTGSTTATSTATSTTDTEKVE